MDRVEKMRAARNSPHVCFTEYIKLRAKSQGLVLVFEGKQCPTAYIGWLQQLFQGCYVVGGQIIARGKRNVLVLRDLILRNPQTGSDRNMYFVDKDYDLEPKLGSFPDVYVTRGYSVENELVLWSSLESFIRAYFDIADSEDQEALRFSGELYESTFSLYVEEARELHRVVYVCHRCGIDCFPGDSVFSYVHVDWVSGAVERSYQSQHELFELLRIDRNEWAKVAAALGVVDGFDELNPVKDWRGKFHFSFVRSFLTYLKQARMSGVDPFKRVAKLNADPTHPSLIGLLGSISARPPCLTMFVEQFSVTAGVALANR